MRMPPVPRGPLPLPLPLAAADAVAASALSAGAVIGALHLPSHPPLVPSAGLALLCTSPVAWRRQAPVAAFVTSVSALVLYQVVSSDPNMPFEPYAVALTAYLAGRRSPLRSPRLVLLSLYGLAALLVLQVLHPGVNSLPGTAGAWVICVAGPIVAGQLVTGHHELASRLAASSAQLRREQEARAARLAGEERNRVARELHDVTAHSLSVMVIQAAAARLLASADRDRARRALLVVQRSGREALDDLRLLMGALRYGDDDPVDVLTDGRGFEALVEGSRAAGLDISLETQGPVGRLPASVHFVAYRVIQEALTNAAKHGAPGPVSVAISASDDEVALTVTNPVGTGARDGVVLPVSGHGLTGMRERVAVLGAISPPTARPPSSGSTPAFQRPASPPLPAGRTSRLNRRPRQSRTASRVPGPGHGGLTPPSPSAGWQRWSWPPR